MLCSLSSCSLVEIVLSFLAHTIFHHKCHIFYTELQLMFNARKIVKPPVLLLCLDECLSKASLLNLCLQLFEKEMYLDTSIYTRHY